MTRGGKDHAHFDPPADADGKPSETMSRNGSGNRGRGRTSPTWGDRTLANRRASRSRLPKKARTRPHARCRSLRQSTQAFWGGWYKRMISRRTFQTPLRFLAPARVGITGRRRGSHPEAICLAMFSRFRQVPVANEEAFLRPCVNNLSHSTNIVAKFGLAPKKSRSRTLNAPAVPLESPRIYSRRQMEAQQRWSSSIRAVAG